MTTKLLTAAGALMLFAASPAFAQNPSGIPTPGGASTTLGLGVSRPGASLKQSGRAGVPAGQPANTPDCYPTCGPYPYGTNMSGNSAMPGQNGYQQGYNNQGYEQGPNGYRQGYNPTYQQGYNTPYQPGYQQGYNPAYQQGYGQNQYGQNQYGQNRSAGAYAAAGLPNQGNVASQPELSRHTVQVIQYDLQRRGFYENGNIDGVWGPNTVSALSNFQQANGLQPTGQLDLQTLAALGIVQQAQNQQQNRSGGSQGFSGSSFNQAYGQSGNQGQNQGQNR